MIQTIEGRIGGGKTYTAMGWIMNHLARGGVVATNINIQADPFEDQYGEKRGLRWALKRYYNYELCDGQLIRLSDVKTVQYATKKGVFDLNEIVMFYKLVPRGTPKKPVLVVVDEAHIHFPQDGYRSIPREVMHFLTLSRHACVDVVFISQHIKNMWCQMLRLAQFRWVVRDMQKYGFPVGLFNLPWLLPHFLKNKNDYDGVTCLSRSFEWRKKYLFEIYRSPELAAAFESMPQAESVEIKKKVMTMKEKFVVLGLGFAAGIAVLIVPACKSRGAEPLPAPLVEQKESIAAPLSIAVPEDRVEYYFGHVDAGWESKFFTSERTYLIGDLCEGLPVVKVSQNLLLTFDMETGEYFKVRFPSKPRIDSE